MSIKKLIWGVAVIACVAVQAEVAYDWTAKGTYTVGKTTTVTLDEDGDLYMKLSGVKAGSEYTFVANGGSVEVVYTYKEEGDVWDQTLVSGVPDVKTDNQDRCIIEAETWYDTWILIEDAEDKDMQVKPTGYYLHVYGDESGSVTLTSVKGVQEEPIPEGDADNHKVLKPGTTLATLTTSFVENSYYIDTPVTAGYTYLFYTTSGEEGYAVNLAFTTNSSLFTLQDVSDTVATAGNSAFLIKAIASGTISYVVSGGDSSFTLAHQYAKSGGLCNLTVNTKGADGKWQIKGMSTKYDSGTSVAILGSQTVVFSAVTGFSTPANVAVTVADGVSSQTITGVYSDKFDPKDDVATGATKLTISAKEATVARTLFVEDDCDFFLFTAKAGTYYNFALTNVTGDAQFVIYKKGDLDTALVTAGTEVNAFSPAAGDYYVRVFHGGEEAAVDAAYTLKYSSANVGVVKFAKTSYSAKKSAGSVALTVNRSAKEGKVRVLYGTVCDEAKPGVDYVAQQGELVWEANDNKAKTITIKLIPDAVQVAISRKFSVQLKAVESDQLGAGEYPASVSTPEAVVTLTETKGSTAKAVTAAKVTTEKVPLQTGTFTGVLKEDGSALTNGFPALASVTLTVKDATKNALSAKVLVAGKTYTFTANTWDTVAEDTVSVEMVNVQKVANVSYTNVLSVVANVGATETSGDWIKAGAQVELLMNVPDTNNKGVQEGIVYVGNLYRNNAKIQEYLTAVTNAVGYYTIALIPEDDSVEDHPAGNGYITLTIDNKGNAKVAGKLADGSTSPSCSSIVAIQEDGEALYVPVYVAKSPSIFGGTLKLVRKDNVWVIDSSETLVWNNDNALLTYAAETGWQMEVTPVGGYFDTISNLQAYYLTHLLSVSTVDVESLFEESLGSGFSYVIGVQPAETGVNLTGSTLSTDKKTLVKSGTLYNLEASVNPCNVQVKLTRATGLVTGSFTVWSENETTNKQKEITGFNHYGILLLNRDDSLLDEDVLTAGYFIQKITRKYETATGATKSGSWSASFPFNVQAIDQGTPDWYADDWGEQDVE